MTQTTTSTSTTAIHIMALDGIVNVNSLFTVALFVGMVSVTSPIDASFTLNPSCTISSTSNPLPLPVPVPAPVHVPTSHYHRHHNNNNNNTGHSHGGQEDDIQIQVQQHLHLDSYYSSMARNLVSFHVYSFASFLFSSLIASALKQAIKLTSSAHVTTSTTHDGGLLLIARANRRMLRAGILASSLGSVSGCVFLVLAMLNLVQIKLGSFFTCTNLYNIGAVVPLLLLLPLSLVAYVCIVLHAFAH